MSESMAIWGAQALVAGVVSVIGWFVRRMIADFEKRSETSERAWTETVRLLRQEAAESAAAIRREIVSRDIDARREGDLHTRRCEVIQARLATAEQRGAAGEAVLHQLAEQLNAMAARIDAIYQLLTEGARRP